jgi:hypothetical protein
MAEIPVFLMHTEPMKKDRFAGIAAHLGVRGELTATRDALFVQDKARALAYALPGSRMAGLLFFTDTSQGLASPVAGRLPGDKVVEEWAGAFLKRFQLLPAQPEKAQVKATFTSRTFVRESVVEDGEKYGKPRRVPLAAEVAVDVGADGYRVTGPRAKVRMAFKGTKGPLWIHRGLWDAIEVFERRPLLSEDDAYRRLTDRLSARGATRRLWRLVGMRLAYFAGEFGGGPDLLLPYYFAEVEFRDPKGDLREGQGPRQLIQMPACP